MSLCCCAASIGCCTVLDFFMATESGSNCSSGGRCLRGTVGSRRGVDSAWPATLSKCLGPRVCGVLVACCVVLIITFMLGQRCTWLSCPLCWHFHSSCIHGGILVWHVGSAVGVNREPNIAPPLSAHLAHSAVNLHVVLNLTQLSMLQGCDCCHPGCQLGECAVQAPPGACDRTGSDVQQRGALPCKQASQSLCTVVLPVRRTVCDALWLARQLCATRDGSACC